jgi:prepilin-type processing-associated H-X9-DG protein
MSEATSGKANYLYADAILAKHRPGFRAGTAFGHNPVWVEWKVELDLYENRNCLLPSSRRFSQAN